MLVRVADDRDVIELQQARPGENLADVGNPRLPNPRDSFRPSPVESLRRERDPPGFELG